MLEHLYFPHDISTFGPTIDFLFELIFWIVMVVWVLVMITMVIFMIRYRTRPGRKAEYIEGNIAPRDSLDHGDDGDSDRAGAAEPFDLGRHQGAWAAGRRLLQGDRQAVQLGDHLSGPRRQARHQGRRHGRERVARAGEQSGADRSRRRRTSSTVSSCRTCGSSRTRSPGRIIQVWFEATETGQYEIPCAELCGFGHSGMLGNLTVQSQEDYDKWLKGQYDQNK